MAMAGLPRHQVLKYMKSLVAPLALVVAVDVCLQLEYGLVMLSAYHSIPVARADPDQHFRRGGGNLSNMDHAGARSTNQGPA